MAIRRPGRRSGSGWPRGAARADRTGVGFARGFTLLELLVVLALVGLVTALAIPNFERLQAAVTRKTERDYILDQFAGLGRQAMLQRRAYVVLGSGPGPDGGLPEAAGGTADAGARGPRTRSDVGGSGPPDQERYVIDLPGGWGIRLDEPLVVYANGLCLGTGLALYHRGAVDSRLELEPPYCRVASDA